MLPPMIPVVSLIFSEMFLRVACLLSCVWTLSDGSFGVFVIAAVFAEGWEEKMNRIRATSPYGHLPSWQLLSVIVKQGADLRQEQLACQLIREMGWIWERAKIPVWIT
jgi:hypothetical protein